MYSTPIYSVMTIEALEILEQLRSRNIGLSFDGMHGHLDTRNATDTSILTPELLDHISLLRWDLIDMMPWKKDGRLICGAPPYHAESHVYDPDEGYDVCEICWPKQFREPTSLDLLDLF